MPTKKSLMYAAAGFLAASALAYFTGYPQSIIAKIFKPSASTTGGK